MGAVNALSDAGFGKTEGEFKIKENLSQVEMTRFGAITWLSRAAGTQPIGAVTSIFDRNITTFYQWYGYNEPNYIKWDFRRKRKLKTIMVYCEGWTDTGTNVIYVDGSNDDTNWTNIDSQQIVNATTYNLGGINQKYRYYRIRMFCAGTTGAWVKIYDVMMSI